MAQVLPPNQGQVNPLRPYEVYDVGNAEHTVTIITKYSDQSNHDAVEAGGQKNMIFEEFCSSIFFRFSEFFRSVFEIISHHGNNMFCHGFVFTLPTKLPEMKELEPNKQLLKILAPNSQKQKS